MVGGKEADLIQWRMQAEKALEALGEAQQTHVAMGSASEQAGQQVQQKGQALERAGVQADQRWQVNLEARSKFSRDASKVEGPLGTLEKGLSKLPGDNPVVNPSGALANVRAFKKKIKASRRKMIESSKSYQSAQADVKKKKTRLQTATQRKTELDTAISTVGDQVTEQTQKVNEALPELQQRQQEAASAREQIKGEVERLEGQYKSKFDAMVAWATRHKAMREKQMETVRGAQEAASASQETRQKIIDAKRKSLDSGA